jgi:hypothetical protein
VFVKAANIKVDAKIRELCARYSDSSVTFKWETRYGSWAGLGIPSANPRDRIPRSRGSRIVSLAAVGVFRYAYTPKTPYAQDGTPIRTGRTRHGVTRNVSGRTEAIIPIPAYRALWVFTTGSDHGSRLLDVTAELALKLVREPIHANDPRYGGGRYGGGPEVWWRVAGDVEMNSRL